MTATETDHQLSVEISGKPMREAVYINGRMLPCESATLELDAQDVPHLTVKLPVVDGLVISLSEPQIGFEEDTRAALVAMGWTPPDGG